VPVWALAAALARARAPVVVPVASVRAEVSGSAPEVAVLAQAQAQALALVAPERVEVWASAPEAAVLARARVQALALVAPERVEVWASAPEVAVLAPALELVVSAAWARPEVSGLALEAAASVSGSGEQVRGSAQVLVPVSAVPGLVREQGWAQPLAHRPA
jgi:hypothetical protein